MEDDRPKRTLSDQQFERKQSPQSKLRASGDIRENQNLAVDSYESRRDAF